MFLPIFSEEPVSKKFEKVFHEALRREGLSRKVSDITLYDPADTLPPDLLSLGQSAKVKKMVPPGTTFGPSAAEVMKSPAGLTRLQRAISLWYRRKTKQLQDFRHTYWYIEPGYGCGNLVQTTLGHKWLVVDIEVSGDISVDEPEDTELISVAVNRVSHDGKDNIWVWTREALRDPACRDALVAMLTCGVPLVAHNGTFDFKWLNNLLSAELRTLSPRRKAWGEMYSRVCQHIYPDIDTMLIHYVLFPGATGDHGLKDLCQKLFGAPEWEDLLKKYTQGKAHYENIPPYLLYSYNAADVFYTRMLLDHLLGLLEAAPAGPRNVLEKVIMPAVRLLIDIEDKDAGWWINEKLGRELEAELKYKVIDLLAKLRKRAGDATPYLSVANLTRVIRQRLWEATQEEAASIKAEYEHLMDPDKLTLIKRPARAPKPLDEDQEFNPGAWQQVLGWLHAHKANPYKLEFDKELGKMVEKPSTNSEALEKMLIFDDPSREVEKFVEALLEYRHTTKMLSTYVTGVLASVRDGRVRPKYKLAGTVTGRLASTKPAIQTIPKMNSKGQGWEFKGMWVTSGSEEVIVGVDYGQIELRCVAEFCGDEEMIRALQPDQPDFFASMLPAAFPRKYRDFDQVLAKQKSDPAGYGEDRGLIKPISHGANYGRKPKAIAKQLKMPLDKAEAMMDAYFDRFPRLKVWQDNTMKYVDGTLRDEQWGELGLWTPFGRRYQVGVLSESNEINVGNAALAFKPQSTGSDICLTAAVDLHTNHLPKLGARICGLIHDAIYVLAPRKNADEVLATMGERMTASAQKVFTRVPFTTDGHIENYWGEYDHQKWLSKNTPKKESK